MTAIDSLIQSIEKDIQSTKELEMTGKLGLTIQRKLMSEYRRWLTRALFHKAAA